MVPKPNLKEGSYVSTGDTKKTIPPSSFHLLKKSSLKEGVILPCIHDWFEAKRRDDDVGNYWRVHNKLYDLESFAGNHPGGSDWIEATKGSDITEAFESSHVANSRYVELLLEKFYVKDTSHPRNSPYTFKENGFYKTLKRRVEPILKEVGTGPTIECLLVQDASFLAFVVLTVIGTYTDMFLIQLAAGIALGLCIGGGHNYLHLRDTWRRYYFDLTLLSSYEFRLTHALSHHNFPNTILDFEVILGEPLLHFLPIRHRSILISYGAVVYSHLGFPLISIFLLLSRLRAIYRGTQKIRLENFIILIKLAIIFAISPSFLVAVKMTIILTLVSSYVLFVNALNTHHHPTAFHDGDETRIEPDFGLCQIDSAKCKTDWYLQSTFTMLTLFGDHPMHHLFPTVDVSKYKYIKKIVLETLREFGELYPDMNQWELFKGSHVQMSRTTTHKIDVYKSRMY